MKYRHVNHGEYSQTIEMQAQGLVYRATIPAEYTRSEYALQYFSRSKRDRNRRPSTRGSVQISPIAPTMWWCKPDAPRQPNAAILLFHGKHSRNDAEHHQITRPQPETVGARIAMQIPIKRSLERVPGGMMIVPLIVGAVVTTLAPRTAAFFGSFTSALFTGALPILAVFYVCMGAKISLRSLPHIVRRGGALMATKVALGLAASFVLGHLIGVEPIHSGWFAGLSTLAVVAAVNDTNGGLYMALMEQYGRPEDSAAYSVMALESGPFLTMFSLGVAGLSVFPWQTLVGAVLPLAAGMLLGNLDPAMRDFLSRGAAVMIPFFAFAIGATLDLHRIWEAGLLGLALGLVTVLLSGVCLILVDRLIGGNGTAGIAASTTAGNAAAVPMLVAAANHSYLAAAGPATVLVAASVIVSSLLVPPLTAGWKSRVTRHTGKIAAQSLPQEAG